MNMLFILIALSLIFLGVGIYVFFWAIRTRQYKELEIQAYSILESDQYQTEIDETPVE
ncbi:MAG: cbb3-type cytochrome oxidase assembly protein CcoS [Gammaproteobacteria bacterium]|nr:cbb3-type cytochrome oxidase assembly protein CcoS [Gammaproteobacteria bacterium]NNM14876.1 cbb3-type cytochrome oxidase assembly protein CcoS [Gammaproteobacteria bacterium]